MILIAEPQAWNSPYYPVEFTFAFYSETFDSVTDTGGKATLNFPAQLPTKFIVRNKVYIADGIYQGEHVIQSVVSQTEIILETDYDSDDSQECFNLVVPYFYLFKGYTDIEEYPTQLPITLIASFTPEWNLDYQISLDVSGYLQKIFTIQPPSEGIDYAMFNKFRLWAEYSTAQQNTVSAIVPYDPKRVVNASITTDDIMAYYLTGQPLTSSQPAIVFDCEKTVVTFLQDVFVRNIFYQGLPVGGDFNDDFNSDFE